MKVAINGLGRIGRAFLKVALETPGLEMVAVNDLGDPANLAYLLKYDSAYGRSGLAAEAKDGALIVDGKHIRFVQETDPAKLPWKELGVDVVVESTGFFESYEKAGAHLTAGAKRVIISAPAKGDETNEHATVLVGINESKLATCTVSSNGSCTTNAASPVVQIIEDALDIEKALLDTVHAYTATQKIVDGPDASDWRRGRAGAHNIVPSSTGAATSVTKAVKGVPFFDGISVRVPVIVGSYVDLTFVVKRDTSKEDVNDILRRAAVEPRWRGIFAVSDEELVSSDIIGRPEASIADLNMTRVAGGNLVKVLAWYDNECGYVHTLARHVLAIQKYL